MRPSDQRGSAPVTSFHCHWCGISGPKGPEWSFTPMGLLPPDSDLVRVPSRGPVCLCSACSVRAAHSEAEGLELCQPQTLPGPLAGSWGGGGRLLHPSPMTRRTCTAGGGGDSRGWRGMKSQVLTSSFLGGASSATRKEVALVPTWGLPPANLHPARQLFLGRAGASKRGPTLLSAGRTCDPIQHIRADSHRPAGTEKKKKTVVRKKPALRSEV